ncbi:hypothetical protein AMAG_04876 [Allomyces macrogynus ATCC 38327]|uniref:GH16 domain-containing protein n=1 Tax=Allomyces macrogynus (strain ATCC 38327) TaxID=578462 RepID=A0A0L0S6C2_ALLM3|nr:hypothetical protein AMAG_04876 [Allomyces macrogynus ATCC 38327]|eukprot:KNE58052.1 hypothetical protein AMAG_04876 [Allomyces macrogynus ATCC 38327]
MVSPAPPPSRLLPLVVAAATLLVLAIAAAPAHASACPGTGKQCEKWAPCCAQNYCVAQPWGCMTSEGCNADASFAKSSCTPRPMCKSFRENFDSPDALINKYNYTGKPDAAHFWREFPGADKAEVVDGNLVLSLVWDSKLGRGQGATIPSIRWLQYGTVTARIKVAAGRGVVSSFITKTDISDKVGDEIDFELLGGNSTQVQTNFYFNGVLDYTRGVFFALPGGQSTTNDYHQYTIDWTRERIRWIVDGKTLREVTPKSVDNKYPSQMARIFFSVWDGGCAQPKGTTEWALGPTDWCNDPSRRTNVPKMYIDWIEVKCATEDDRPDSTFMPVIATPTTPAATSASTASMTVRAGANNPSATGTSSSGTGPVAQAGSAGTAVMAAAAAAAGLVAAVGGL